MCERRENIPIFYSSYFLFLSFSLSLSHQSLLHSVVKHLLSHYDFIRLCSMEHFLPLLDRLRGASQIEVNKAILRNFSKLTDVVKDQLIINVLFSVGKVVHDSVTSLTGSEEREEITNLCIAFIRGVDYGRDVEKHLNFFVECRFLSLSSSLSLPLSLFFFSLLSLSLSPCLPLSLTLF